ncbi:MAG: hypothetical protein KDH88_08275 [Chromatiales bacterium]|nr:hypothetical protein [Chromatiales bacterium]
MAKRKAMQTLILAGGVCLAANAVAQLADPLAAETDSLLDAAAGLLQAAQAEDRQAMDDATCGPAFRDNALARAQALRLIADAQSQPLQDNYREKYLDEIQARLGDWLRRGKSVLHLDLSRVQGLNSGQEMLSSASDAPIVIQAQGIVGIEWESGLTTDLPATFANGHWCFQPVSVQIDAGL